MFIANGLEGLKVTVVPLYEIVPVTGVTTFVPAIAGDPVKIKDDVLNVAGFIFLLNVAETTWFKGMPISLLAGMDDTTSGQIPVVAKYVSFLHPVIKTSTANTRLTDLLLVFIFPDLHD